jgi:cell division protein FtsI (penicillin-binding protein 3)
MSDAPRPPPSPSTPARRFGAPAAAGVPKIETIRDTAPDHNRRLVLERTRARLVIAAACFAVLFTAVVVKLADATILQPMMPKAEREVRRPDPPPPPAAAGDGLAANGVARALDTVPTALDLGLHARRATITDRNGEILAISLPISDLYANPKVVYDIDDVVQKLKSVLPRLDEAAVRRELARTDKQFVYLERRITPREQLAINALGIVGVDFQGTERRRYPLGRVAAQVLGGVDVDGNGVAGVERYFDERLRQNPEPLRLSIDVRVQAVVRDELSHVMEEFSAIGACGIVMDVRTGEVLAMVSLPDYDANDVGTAAADDRFNRAVTGMYEPGSTFKLQTASMALDGGIVQLWSMWDAIHPIRYGRFTITDFEGKHRMLYLPEVLAYSSNLGAARIAATVGAERQREWLRRMGMFVRSPIELPEAGRPIVPSVASWKEIATMTIGFGHGIAVSPLHIVRGTAAIANGGILLRPTILARPADAPPPQGERVMQQSTSDVMRKLMRLVVTDGFGKSAEVAGYFVGGKTGTAEKVGAHGYKKKANVAAFMSVFPMNAPRYAVYMMLDEPHATAKTFGYATAGWVAAPAAGRVIARIGPMLGLLPQTENAAAIQASLAIPLEPPHGAGVPAAVPPPAPRPATTAHRPPAPPEHVPPVRDLRHEARAAPLPAFAGDGG